MSTPAIANPDSADDRPPLRRRWIPLSLKMFVALLLFCIGWSVWRLGIPAYRQYLGIREIERVGGWVQSQPVGPTWLRGLVGERWMEMTLDDVESAVLADTEATDETLRPICGLPRLRDIWLQNTRVTDSGLRYLRPLTELETLMLGNTHVTDDGLVVVGELNSLRDLHLSETKITDAGLRHLKRLTNLEHIWLYETPVTDGGEDELQAVLPSLKIDRNRDAPISSNVRP